MLRRLLLLMVCCTHAVAAQDYYFEKYQPFTTDIPSPEEFLGYPIGEYHTRHDLIVAYFTRLAEVSDRATIEEYGKTHEGRKLVMLTISTPENIRNLDTIKQQHLAFVDPEQNVSNYDEVPIFINQGYSVHGNEPSTSEAALLTAYTFVASNNPEILNYLNNAVLFVDPVLNPDGRDRHTQWANMYRGNPLVSDPQDAEHNEYWPRGRTNHYWFDLNRDWLLGIHPESRGKLTWYHQWYPNVVTDFHEMGTQSSYFFEPMKDNASLDPIMPRENYEDLNNLFGDYFAEALDSIGSFYFTKEVFDGTYPGYGSSYPDLQGALALLFEQASSRGHVQKTAFGEITFPFTIRNQYVSGMTTVKAAVENKATLRKYQQDFFKSALSNAAKSRIQGYTFKEGHDQNRTKAFIDKLLLHKVAVYKSSQGYTVPTKQPQYRMVQTFFETYEKYRDSVYYDASAWSVANFYNMDYASTSSLNLGEQLQSVDD
ncbi:MAG: M14 family zinc carboxypeptidase, partial [Bacteroidota bacterium]